MKEKYQMLEEIIEQKEILSSLISSAELKEEISRLKSKIKPSGRIFLVGSGSSYNAALFASHLLSEKNSLLASAYQASDFVNYLQDLKKNDLVFLISQSGESRDILNLIKPLKKAEVTLVAITNSENSTLAESSQIRLFLSAGSIVAVPATKTFSATLVLFIIISAVLSGVDYKGDKKIIVEINKMFSKRSLLEIKRLSQRLLAHDKIFILGEGLDYPLALEAALKIKECALVEAEGFSAHEFCHGPIALVKRGLPLIIISTDSQYFDDQKDVWAKVRKTGGKIFAFSTKNSQLFSDIFPIADCGIYSSVLAAIAIQLLSYFLAIKKKNNPDKPPGLDVVVR